MTALPGRRYAYRHTARQRFTPSRPARTGYSLPAWQKSISCMAVAVVCATMIAAIWIAVNHQIREQRIMAVTRAAAVVTGQANILAEAVRLEMDTIDQSLAILRAAWNQNPQSFSLKSWQSAMPAITAVAKDIFISNDKGVIVQDILPQAVGQGVGSAYTDLGFGSLESVLTDIRTARHPGLVEDEQATGGVARRYLMYVLRPLGKPAGWWIGASYRSDALVKLFAEGALGPRGLAALIDTRVGGVQAIAGPAALRPPASITGSVLYKAIERRKSDAGIWIGPTPMDNEIRIDAFRRLPQRGLIVLAGVDKAGWMAPATVWARNARIVAGLASLLVVGLGGLVLLWLWRLDSSRRQRVVLEQSAIQLNSAQSGLQLAELATQTHVAQVSALMAGSSDGVALFDAEWRLTHWNAPFAEASGLPGGFLREGRPVDDIFRQQAQAGLFAGVRDAEAEITRRLSQLRQEKDLASFTQQAPGGRTVTIRGCATPDGGLLLIVTGARVPAGQALVPLPTVPEPEELPDSREEPPVEW